MSAQAALVEIQRFQKIFNAFRDAENLINELTSIDQSLAERTTALNKLTDEYNATILANEVLLGETNLLNEAYNKEEASQKARVDEEVSSYRSSELDRVNKEVALNIQDLTTKAEELQASIVRMQGQSSQLQQSITDKQITLDDLSTKISSAQATIQTLLGA